MWKKSVSIFLVFLFSVSPFQPLWAMETRIDVDNYTKFDDSSDDQKSVNLSDCDYITSKDGARKFIKCSAFLNSGSKYIKVPLLALAIPFEMLQRGLQLSSVGLHVAFVIGGLHLTPEEAYFGIKTLAVLLAVPAAGLVPALDKVIGLNFSGGLNNLTSVVALKGYQNSELEIEVGGNIGIPLPGVAPISLPPTIIPISIPLPPPTGPDNLEEQFDIKLPPIGMNAELDIDINPNNKSSINVDVDLGLFDSILQQVKSGAIIYVTSVGLFLTAEELFLRLVDSKGRPRFFEENFRYLMEAKLRDIYDHCFPGRQDDEVNSEHVNIVRKIIKHPVTMSTYSGARFAGLMLIIIGSTALLLDDLDPLSRSLNFSTMGETTNLSSTSFESFNSYSFPFGKVFANASGSESSSVYANSQIAAILYFTLEGLSSFDNAQLFQIGGAILLAYGLTGYIFASFLR